MSAILAKVRERYEAGQERPAPAPLNDPRADQLAGFTPAAVLVAFTEKPDPGLLLLHRPSNMRSHPGQVAFPGGKVDPGETVEQAALREAHEELGIAPEQVRVIGAGDRYRTGSGFDITPVLGVVPPNLEIRPNPAEVAQWFEAPARFVLDPANHTFRTVVYDGLERRYVEIVWEGHRIWGVTGALIHALAHRMAWND